MSTVLKTDLENAQQCLLETYELAVAYGDNETKNTNDYLALMENICQIRDLSERNEKALEKAMQEHTIVDFEASFQREVAKNKKKLKPKNTNEYKRFKQRLEQIANIIGTDNDNAEATSNKRRGDDVFVLESRVNVNDPITRKRLEDPMRNNICGHVYEKSSILEAIMTNCGIRCPVAGCGNKKFVEASHLIPDLAFKRKLQQMAESEMRDEDSD